MRKEKIEQIRKDIEKYQQAIEDAEGALAEAERELDELLASEDPDIREMDGDDLQRAVELSIQVLVNRTPVQNGKVVVPDNDDECPF